jgi:co-chaperonin GroES (HSP10)
MIELTLADLLKHRPCNNNVILKSVIDTSKFKYGSVEFYSPVSLADGKAYDPFSTAPIVCKVISTPKNLIFGTHKVLYTSHFDKPMPKEQRKALLEAGREHETTYIEQEWIEQPIPGSMPWKTTMDLKQGDIVWVSSNALVIAEQHGGTIEADKEIYYVIQYSELIMVKRGKNVKMLNGFMLLEPVDEPDSVVERAKKSGIVIPDITKQKKKSDKYAIVRYIGEPVEYLFNNKDRMDYPEIKLGDTVLMSWGANRRLENGEKYLDGREYIASRRANITAIMGT